MPKNPNKNRTLPIYLLNGPNLNMLGTREPDIYGHATLAEVEKMAADRAKSLGLALVAMQSNREGELVDFIQEAHTHASAVILNAGAYTHTSVAVLDALKMLTIPVIEVHLSNPAARESFRHHSYVALGATGAITGIGPYGYQLAIEAVAHLLNSQSSKGQSSKARSSKDTSK